MSDTTLPRKTPQINALRSLQRNFTTEQIQAIADECQGMAAAKLWGDVVITFVNGTPKKVTVSVSKKLPGGDQ